MQPNLTKYQTDGPRYANLGNDPLYRADPTELARDQSPPPIFPNSLGQSPLAGNAPRDIPPNGDTQDLLAAIANLPAMALSADAPPIASGDSLGALPNLQPTTSDPQADASYVPDSQRAAASM